MKSLLCTSILRGAYPVTALYRNKSTSSILPPSTIRIFLFRKPRTRPPMTQRTSFIEAFAFRPLSGSSQGRHVSSCPYSFSNPISNSTLSHYDLTAQSVTHRKTQPYPYSTSSNGHDSGYCPAQTHSGITCRFLNANMLHTRDILWSAPPCRMETGQGGTVRSGGCSLHVANTGL